jgi:hypothetical protein
MHRQRGLAPNRGGKRARRRPRADHAVCSLSGSLRFVDGGGRWAALAVRDATSLGRRLVGSVVTLDLGAARLGVDDRNGDGIVSTGDLLPGDEVRVTAPLPRANGRAPGTIHVRRLTATGPMAAT